MKLKFIACVLLLSFSHGANGVSLSEYGVSLTQNGLVDHASGLRWLDSAYTDGNLDDLQEYLDAGWRIASEAEFIYLMARSDNELAVSYLTDLNIDGINQIASRLSFDLDGDLVASGPWLCRSYGDSEQNCQATDSFGGQFALSAFEASGGSTDLTFYVYLSEVEIYGALFCGTKLVCDYEGRSLLVRPVPLPPAVMLFLGALAFLAPRKK